jgi:hypothetical protein
MNATWSATDSDRLSLTTCRTKLAKSWRVLIMRNRGEYIGSVEAPDRQLAEAVAVKLFQLGRDQRSRLLIRERA